MSAEYRPGVGRASSIDRPIDRNSDTANMSSGLRSTPVSVLTGAGRLVQRAPPEPRPKCDRVDFRQKYARLHGEYEFRRLSGDPQIRPETVGYVT